MIYTYTSVLIWTHSQIDLFCSFYLCVGILFIMAVELFTATPHPASKSHINSLFDNSGSVYLCCALACSYVHDYYKLSCYFSCFRRGFAVYAYSYMYRLYVGTNIPCHLGACAQIETVYLPFQYVRLRVDQRYHQRTFSIWFPVSSRPMYDPQHRYNGTQEIQAVLRAFKNKCFAKFVFKRILSWSKTYAPLRAVAQCRNETIYATIFCIITCGNCVCLQTVVCFVNCK